MERNTVPGSLSGLSSQPAAGSYLLTMRVSHLARGSSCPQMSCPSYHLVEQNLTFPTMLHPDCRFMS